MASASSSFSVRATLEKTRQSSKAELKRLAEQSEMKIQSLEIQLAHERAVFAVMQYLLSPIYNLPAELLAEIFKHAVDEDTHLPDVLRVSQVCSEWRQVAHNTPRLWTGPIHVALDNKGDEWEPALTDSLTAWLARSGALPIPIALSLDSADVHDDLLEVVLKISSRWRSLRLNFPDHGLPLLCRLAQRRLDSLEEIDLGRTSFSDTPGSVLPYFTVVPRLRKLKINIYSSLPILVPWANLTDLTLRRCESPDLALYILSLCSGLVRALVRTVGWSVLSQASQDHIAFPCLRTLTFGLIGDREHFTPLFNTISAPGLQGLCLKFGDMETSEQWMDGHFTAFQLQAPNITRLELQYAEITSDALVAVIRHASSLTHLKLFACFDFDDAVVRALRYEDGVTPLVHHLHNLVLEGMEQDVTDDVLASMIASRWWTDAALASRSAPPVAARWTHVTLWYDLSDHFLLEDIPPDVLITSTRRFPGRDHLLFAKQKIVISHQ